MAAPGYGSVPGLASSSRKEPTLNETLAPYVAEFVGTFMLVFAVGVYRLIGSAMWNATAVAATYAAMIYTFGCVSGGHFNPAVTISFGLVRQASWSWHRVVGYIIAQFAGAVLAGWLCFDALGEAATVTSPLGYSWLYAGAVELIYTAMLCTVALNCIVSARNNPHNDQNCFFGLAIGLVLVAGGYAAGSISGAFFNPALTLCIDLFGKTSDAGFGGWWRASHLVSQLLGAGIAAIFFDLSHPRMVQGTVVAGDADSDEGLSGEFAVRVQAACNLRSRGTGGSPHVIASVGQTEYHTSASTSSDHHNPIWTGENVCEFNVAPGDASQMFLKVMSGDTCLGTTVVNLFALPAGEWPRSCKLVDGQGVQAGELAVELRRTPQSPTATIATGIAEHTAAPLEQTVATRLVCEFVGTFAFVFTFGLNVVTKSPATAWSAAAAYISMLYSFGQQGGGYFNPAITFAVALSRRGKCSPQLAFAYIVMQLGAGTVAGLLYARFHAAGPFANELFGLAPGASVHTRGATYSWNDCFIAEFALTFLLAFVALAVATTTPLWADWKHNFHIAIAIGSCVMAGNLAASAISGGELNPALCFGLSTASWAHHGQLVPPPWTNALFFSTYELAAGAAAALAFFLSHTSEYTKASSLKD